MTLMLLAETFPYRPASPRISPDWKLPGNLFVNPCKTWIRLPLPAYRAYNFPDNHAVHQEKVTSGQTNYTDP
jgi:hypothetical protein